MAADVVALKATRKVLISYVFTLQQLKCRALSKGERRNLCRRFQTRRVCVDISNLK